MIVAAPLMSLPSLSSPAGRDVEHVKSNSPRWQRSLRYWVCHTLQTPVLLVEPLSPLSSIGASIKCVSVCPPMWRQDQGKSLVIRLYVGGSRQSKMMQQSHSPISRGFSFARYVFQLGILLLPCLGV